MKKHFLFILLFVISLNIAEAATIKNVSYTEPLIGGQINNLDIKFEGNVDGVIAVYDMYSQVLAMKPVTGDDSIPVEVPFDLIIVIKYMENDKVVDIKTVGPLPETPESGWASIDLRALTSDNKTIVPLAIKITNKIGKKIEAELKIQSLFINGSVGSEKIKKITIPENPNIYNTNFSISPNEEFNDVKVILTYHNSSITETINTFIKAKPGSIGEKDLPKRPGEILQEQLNNKTQEDGEKRLETGKQISTTLIVAVSIILTILILFFAVKYLKNEP
jgi:hypothetical protein